LKKNKNIKKKTKKITEQKTKAGANTNLTKAIHENIKIKQIKDVNDNVKTILLKKLILKE
jgi:hypothetical protein